MSKVFKKERMLITAPNLPTGLYKDYLDSNELKQLSFTITVLISAEGKFYTYLPADVIAIFDKFGLGLKEGNKGKKGYFESKEYNALLIQVRDTCMLLFQRELIEDTIVIKYNISTYAVYVKTKDDLAPNGNWSKRDYPKWKHGTVDFNASNPRSFGIMAYAKPFTKKTYRYITGYTYTEYNPFRLSFAIPEKTDSDYFLKRLASYPCISESGVNGKTKEIPYTEATAKLFCDVLFSICALSDQISNFLDPDSLTKIAEMGSGLPLLTGGSL